MVTHDPAVYFLEVILKMPPTWRDLLQNKPLDFLTLYIKRHATRVPFQNMHMAAVPEEHRWFPSHDQLVENGLSGRGGCCLPLNYFSKLVFQAVGLDSFNVRGDHYRAPVVGTHCMTMVRLHGAKDKGLYMVEVGGAFPCLEPIPMDNHKLPFRTLQAAGFPYEFREIGPGWIGKFHIGGGTMGGAFTEKKETLRTSWDLKPRDLWEFDYPMLETYTKPCYSVLLRLPYMYRCFTNTQFQKLFPKLPENVNGAGGLVPIKNIKSAKIIKEEKTSLEQIISKLHLDKNDEDFKVVTEEDSDDDLEDPKNFVFAYKLRLVVADAKSRNHMKKWHQI